MASSIIDEKKAGEQDTTVDGNHDGKPETIDSTIELSRIIRSKQQILYNAHATFFNELVDVLVERERCMNDAKRGAGAIDNSEVMRTGQHPASSTEADPVKSLQEQLTAASREIETLKSHNFPVEDKIANGIKHHKHYRAMQPISENLENKENIEPPGHSVNAPTGAAVIKGTATSCVHDINQHLTEAKEEKKEYTVAQYNELRKENELLVAKIEALERNCRTYQEAYATIAEKLRKAKLKSSEIFERRQKHHARYQTSDISPRASGTGVKDDNIVERVSAQPISIPSEEIISKDPAHLPLKTQASNLDQAAISDTIASYYAAAVVSDGDSNTLPPNSARGRARRIVYDSDATTDEDLELDGFDPTSRAILSTNSRDGSTITKVNTDKSFKHITHIKQEHSTPPELKLPASPIVIKSEPDSEMEPFVFTQQSLDLDDIGSRPETPRKRRFVSNFPCDVSQPEAADAVAGKLRELIDVPGKVHERTKRREDKSPVGSSHEATRDPAEALSKNFNHNQPSSEPSAVSNAYLPASRELLGDGGVRLSDGLRPMHSPRQQKISGCFQNDSRESDISDPSPAAHTLFQNTKTLIKVARDDKKNTAQPTRTVETHQISDQMLDHFAEDGVGAPRLGGGQAKLSRTERDALLGALLETPPAKVRPIAHLRKDGEPAETPAPKGPKSGVPSTVQSRAYGPSKILGDQTAKKRRTPLTDPPVSKRKRPQFASPDADSRRASHIGTTAIPRSPSNASVTPGSAPGKQGAALRITDFKINPTHANGLAYAFSDVIRDRDARRCLPGCRKSCCAAIPEFLSKAGMPPQKGRALRWRSTSPVEPPDGEEEDSDKARKEELELVLQKYGRHKERFEGQQSIPGFWDLDMPDTQQVKESRKRAAEEEKERAEMMLKEAKKGGRYKFRHDD